MWYVVKGHRSLKNRKRKSDQAQAFHQDPRPVITSLIYSGGQSSHDSNHVLKVGTLDTVTMQLNFNVSFGEIFKSCQ